MRAGVLSLLLLTLAGCHIGLAGLVLGASKSNGAYQPGAIAAENGPDYVRTLACLDIGLAIHDDHGLDLLDMDVGNRCVHGEPFDLKEMLIRAHDANGDARTVELVDPRHEIVFVHIGALERGHERIRLTGLDEVEEVCFELTRVVPDAPHTRSAPLCLFRAVDGWRARPFS